MRNLNLLLISASLLSLTACNPKYYTPNTQNVPLISKKGGSNLTLAGNANQLEFQGAYGVTENIAVQLNAGLFKPAKLSNGNTGSGNLVEIGAGYFKPLENNFVFETYAILGFGSMKNDLPSAITTNPPTTGKISANISRIGIQPNFGYKTKNFSAAISSRFVNINYNKIEGDLIFGSEDQVAYLKRNSSNFLIEPALTLRGGFENIKLQLQYGYSLNVSNSTFRQDKSYATLGVSFNLK